MSPKRLRKSNQMSVRTPLPMAIRTLWCFSLSFCGATSSQSQSRGGYAANLSTTRVQRRLPWACCRGSAAFRRCTASPSRCTSCSHPRTERQRTSSLGKRSCLKATPGRDKAGERFPVCFLNGKLKSGMVTPLDGSRQADEEASAVIQRQVDVEDVI